MQIGETRYGRPILDRVIKPTTPLERAALCGLVSMEATIRSNLTAGHQTAVEVHQKKNPRDFSRGS